MSLQCLPEKVRIELDKKTTLMKVANLTTNAYVIEEMAPVVFDLKKVTVTLKEKPEEYFYGGGVQNGRFSHKNKVIAIENQNSWTDGRSSFTYSFLLVYEWLWNDVVYFQERGI